jgi:hypothetical protein
LRIVFSALACRLCEDRAGLAKAILARTGRQKQQGTGPPTPVICDRGGQAVKHGNQALK